MSAMNDDSTLVQAEAAESTMELLDSIESPLTLLPTDFKVFQLYILPTYQRVNCSESVYIRCSLMKLIGKLCANGRKFVEQGITSQTAYFKSLRDEETREEIKGKEKEGIDFYIGVENEISNLNTEMDAMEGAVQSMILNTMFNVDSMYQGAFVPYFCDVIKSLGSTVVPHISSALFSMLNTKSFPLRLNVFKYAPRLNVELGVDWAKGLIVYFNLCLKRSEELLIYYVIECFVHLVKIKNLEKAEMKDLYQKVALFFVHPNVWIRTAAIRFCKTVGETQSDTDFFFDMRTLLNFYLNDLLIITGSEPFHEFLRSPLTRFALDYAEHEAKETEKGKKAEDSKERELNYFHADAYARTILGSKHELKELNPIYNAKEEKAAYDEFISRLKREEKQLPLNCIGSTQFQYMLLGLLSKGMSQDDNLQNNIFVVSEDFEMAENEVDQYISKGFAPHVLPDPSKFYSDNNGMNPSSGYVNFQIARKPDISWPTYFKNASLCKALGYYSHDVWTYLESPAKPASQMWKPKGRLMATLRSHEAPVRSISISDSTQLMATGDADGVCCIWDAKKLKEFYAVPLGGKIVVEGAVSALRFLPNTHTLAVGSNKGAISVFKLDKDIKKEKYIPAENEGSIVNCHSFDEGYNTIVYATQKGRVHIHDLRIRADVNSLDTGCERGLVSAFSVGPDENSYFIGTGAGYVLGYDIRFNLITSVCRHASRSPIMDMCTYVPEKNLKLGVNTPVPLLFITSAVSTPQIDLCYLNKETPEWSFVAGSSKLQYHSYTPYGLIAENSPAIQRRVPESVLSRSKERHSPFDCFKEFSESVRTMYEEDSRIYRILCPRTSRTEESASYLLSAGADRVVRYWYLEDIAGGGDLKTKAAEMVKNSFVVTSPDNREVEYAVGNFKEKVLFEKPVRKPTDNGRKGQSIWQEMNGTSYFRHRKSRSPHVSHADAILNMEVLEASNKRYLVTCGRDNLVKLWL